LLLSSSKETSILSPTALTNSLYTEVAVFLVGTKILHITLKRVTLLEKSHGVDRATQKLQYARILHTETYMGVREIQTKTT
jgi:hypothetical protein